MGVRRGYVAGTMETMLAMEAPSEYTKMWNRAWYNEDFRHGIWENYVMVTAGGEQRVRELVNRGGRS